jgi:hypothetical protein
MKYVQSILILAASLLSVAGAGCTTHTADPAEPLGLSPPSDGRQIETALPDQELKGLLAQAAFKRLYDPVLHTHSLDLRLTNREGEPRRNVRVERITLASYLTQFTPPPPATLWNRGSSVDYPSIAFWTLPAALRTRLPLDVLVRYEDRFGKGVVAQFRWEVTVEPSDPYATEAAEHPNTK